MIRTFRKRMRSGAGAESGAAATEMALLSLVLVPTLLYSTFLFELSWTKIKAREAARYLVWEMSAVGLSDWKEAKHQERFDTVKQVLMTEVSDRYSGDMQSATPTYLSGNGPKPMMLEVTFKSEQTTLESVDAGLWEAGQDFGVDTGPVGKAFDWYFENMKFNTAGKVKGSIQVHIKNTYLGKTMPVFYTDKMLLQDEWDIRVPQSLIVEQWDLKKGEAVNETHQDECTTDYCHQVHNMFFAGFGDDLSSAIGGGGVLGTIFSALNIHLPTEVVVVSLPLNGTSTSQVPLDYGSEIYRPKDHGSIKHKNTVKKQYSNVYKDTVAPDQSPYNKVYVKRGKYFLGCKQSQRQEPGGDETCDY
ncbi:MAG TPA: hypothetical protein VGK67_22555 [Myxococcales bacterium]|jgi:hypothetical protein